MSVERCEQHGHYDTDFHEGCPVCGEVTERCPDCGALVNGHGMSIDERCCFYCKGD